MPDLSSNIMIRKSADVSECGRYRWWLRRSWGQGHRVVTFVMLNPSTADHEIDDPTIRRSIRFAQDWGFDVLSVRNLFALRATNPQELLTANCPTGGSRGDRELALAATAQLVVAAWGAFVPFDREREALSLLRNCQLHHLGLTKHGRPRHPLYVPASTQPTEWCVESVRTNP